MRVLSHPYGQIATALALTIPWVGVWATGRHPSTGIEVLVTGLAVLGASFLLAWGAETAEKDVPRPFAIAVLAVVAVAPEYAVDALYAWNAGAFWGTPRGAEAANLAIANMTGANRILIGLGWSGIAMFTVWRAVQTKDPAVEKRPGFLDDVVHLDQDIATEITFLFLATAWAFIVPLNGGIDAFDTIILVGLYVAYILIVIRAEVELLEEYIGVPKYLQSLSRPRRVSSVVALFVYAGVMIFTAVEPFAHGLEELGVAIGVPPFFMIQWIAPLASEAPELIVVAVLVNKARATAGFNALISSKLNQWTLLIGTLAVVYSLALGQYGVLPFDQKQAAEIWITAGQSYFALALLCNFKISIREAIALLVLFVSQVVLEFLILRVFTEYAALSYDFLIAYTVVYMVAGTVLFVKRRRSLWILFGLAIEAARAAYWKEAKRPGHAD